jgi:hypothetical protein
MVNFFSSLLLALIILAIALVASFVVSLGFLLIGSFLARWFSLTQLEATGVALVVGILLTYLIVRIIEIPMPFVSLPDDFEVEEPPPMPRSGRRRRKQ